MKKTLDVFLRALCTGFAIGIGGAGYLSCDNKYLGAFLFGTGLFTILTFGFNLFTGKVGYAVEREPAYILELLIVRDKTCGRSAEHFLPRIFLRNADVHCC